jgi:site-specific DNA-methyltransferase (adenine-specific)
MSLCLQGDCLELMKDLPDKSIDLFLCDLPYGCLNGGGGNEKKGRKEGIHQEGGCKWDIKIDLEKFWVQVKRLCKSDNTPILMFCNTKFGIDLINSNPDWFRYDLVWQKNGGTNFLLANKQPMRSHEMIYVFSKKGSFYKNIKVKVEGKKGYKRPKDYHRSGIAGCIKPILETSPDVEDNTRCVLSVINFPTRHNKLHPTCKTIELYKWLIERYSNEGDMVLDPTAGSFNSGRACIELNRQYIGMEMNKEFYDNNKIGSLEI